jgi:hypothetical protein
MWIYDKATKGMALKQISYVPGFFKIFDEILVNAADNKVSDMVTGDRHEADLFRSTTPPWTPSRYPSTEKRTKYQCSTTVKVFRSRSTQRRRSGFLN